MKAGGANQLTGNSAWSRAALAVASGVLLGASFPPSPVYSVAYVALIPLLLLLETVEGTWRVIRYSYITFFIFHAITLYWIGGFVVGKDIWMMIAGGAVVLVHPVFYLIVVLLYKRVRRRLGLVAGFVFLPLIWITYEYSHSLSEFSFPWITLGNSQAYDLRRIQIAEFTSVYGISFLILCFNIIGFVLITKLATRSWTLRSRATAVSLVALIVLYFGPWVYGIEEMSRFDVSPEGNTLRIGVVQPNVDPWEKWGSTANPWDSYDRQIANYLKETRALSDDKVDLVVWPETAIPFRILLPGNQMYWHWVRGNLDSSRTPVLTGLPYTVFYDSANAPVTASKDPIRNRYYDDFNSTTLIVPGKGIGPIYKKIVLVPFAERIPYAGTFKFLIEPVALSRSTCCCACRLGRWSRQIRPSVMVSFGSSNAIARACSRLVKSKPSGVFRTRSFTQSNCCRPRNTGHGEIRCTNEKPGCSMACAISSTDVLTSAEKERAMNVEPQARASSTGFTGASMLPYGLVLVTSSVGVVGDV